MSLASKRRARSTRKPSVESFLLNNGKEAADIAKSLASQFLERDADRCTLDEYTEEEQAAIRAELIRIAQRIRRGLL